MVIIPFNSCKNIKWKLDVYEADGYYIKECYDNNTNRYFFLFIYLFIYLFIFHFID